MKIVLIAIYSSLLISCSYSHSGSNSIDTVPDFEKMFAEWQQQQIADGKYRADDSCNSKWIIENTDRIKNDDRMMGFHKEAPIHRISTADLNSDGKTDALISFQPRPCDGGSGGKWLMEHLFILSNGDKYEKLDSINVGSFVGAPKNHGFYWLDSIGSNKIFATYFTYEALSPKDTKEYLTYINYQMIFDFNKKKLISSSDCLNCN